MKYDCAKKEAEMERQKAKIKCELQRRKLTAKDECRIRAAELEAAPLQQRNDC